MNDSKRVQRMRALYGATPSDEWMVRDCPWCRQMDDQEAAAQRQADELVRETEAFLKEQA